MSKRRMSNAIKRDRTRLLDEHRDLRHAQRLWVSGPSNSRWHFRLKNQKVSAIQYLEKEKCKAVVQSWMRGGGLKLKLAWIGIILLALHDTLIEEPMLCLCEKAISNPKVGKEWCQRTNRAVSTWNKPCRKVRKVTYRSTLKNSVRDAIRRGAAENEVQTHEKKLTRAWRQMSTLRRRYEKLCKGDDIEDCTHKRRYELS